MRPVLSLLVALLCLGCLEEKPARLFVVDVIVPSVAGAAPADAPTTLPPDALAQAVERAPGRWALSLRHTRGVRVAAEGACPTEVHPAPAGADAAAEPVHLAPLYTIEGARDELGFGGRFALSARSDCVDMVGARFAWRVDGAELGDLRAEGGEVSGTMPTLRESLGGAPTGSGVIALSPRTRGTVTLVLTITTAAAEMREERVMLHAAARSTGMPSVPTNVGIYVAGTDLGLLSVPPDAEPELVAAAPGVYRFETSTPGRYLLGTGPQTYAFSLLAGSHAATPLDCGRAECHAATTTHAASSPMTRVFSRLSALHGYAPACALGCHTVGEPGTADGGFSDLAEELGVAMPEHGGAGVYERLPRELRRLSGVGCTACHGPGRVPEPGAKSRILRTDVCATCHDAPPRYGHVAALSQNRMSRAAQADGLDASPLCLTCHTTDAFLYGVADADGAPREVDMDGHGCATCHAPHAADPGPALLRTLPLPEILSGVSSTLAEHPSRVCTTCHAPAPDFDLPTASATALLVARGGLTESAEPAPGEAPHASLEGGCLACHGSAPVEGVDRGASHAFGVAPTVCASCHEGESFDARRDALAARAEALFERAGAADSRAVARPGAPRSARERARYDIALVYFDRGAFAHGGAYAERLLETAESELMRGAR